MAVPTAAKAVEMTPKMALNMPWKTERSAPIVEVMVVKMLEIRFSRELMREGIISGEYKLILFSFMLC